MIYIYNKLYKFFNSILKDKCEVCHGKRGGTRGNENIVNGKIMCDYCDVDTMK